MSGFIEGLVQIRVTENTRMANADCKHVSLIHSTYVLKLLQPTHDNIRIRNVPCTVATHQNCERDQKQQFIWALNMNQMSVTFFIKLECHILSFITFCQRTQKI